MKDKQRSCEEEEIKHYKRYMYIQKPQISKLVSSPAHIHLLVLLGTARFVMPQR
jgi:hypothetical protein